jgi:tRNA-specific 2-thiouridylase
VGAGAGAYAAFVEGRAKERLRPGPIVDADGRTVGAHEGVHRFTVGQRKGLGVALGQRTFVAAIEPATATVRLGRDEDLSSTTARIDDVVLAPDVALPIDARVRVRYRHEGEDARIEQCTDDAARIAFMRPVRAVSRGQIAVFYEGDRVLGGGRIC